MVSKSCAVNFLYIHASGLLVKTVNILGYDALDKPALFPFCKYPVGSVWLSGSCIQIFSVVIKEDLRFVPKAFIA